jgi:hypothetical protein
MVLEDCVSLSPFGRTELYRPPRHRSRPASSTQIHRVEPAGKVEWRWISDANASVFPRCGRFSGVLLKRPASYPRTIAPSRVPRLIQVTFKRRRGIRTMHQSAAPRIEERRSAAGLRSANTSATTRQHIETVSFAMKQFHFSRDEKVHFVLCFKGFFATMKQVKRALFSACFPGRERAPEGALSFFVPRRGTASVVRYVT